MEADEARQRRFRAVYEDHLDRVARYAARRIDAREVHDVAAETFLVAWRRLDDVPQDALPWLFATARRVMANRRRSTTRRRALDEKLAAVPAPRSDAPDAGGIDRKLLAAIAALPEAEREAFMLVAWDGLEPARAAEAAGCGAGTFRMRLHRARTQLKRDLTPDAELPADVTATMEDSR